MLYPVYVNVELDEKDLKYLIQVLSAILPKVVPDIDVSKISIHKDLDFLNLKTFVVFTYGQDSHTDVSKKLTELGVSRPDLFGQNRSYLVKAINYELSSLRTVRAAKEGIVKDFASLKDILLRLILEEPNKLKEIEEKEAQLEELDFPSIPDIVDELSFIDLVDENIFPPPEVKEVEKLEVVDDVSSTLPPFEESVLAFKEEILPSNDLIDPKDLEPSTVEESEKEDALPIKPGRGRKKSLVKEDPKEIPTTGKDETLTEEEELEVTLRINTALAAISKLNDLDSFESINLEAENGSILTVDCNSRKKNEGIRITELLVLIKVAKMLGSERISFKKMVKRSY